MTTAGPILIVGGGIGGLAAALALAQRGFNAHVLERRAVFSEVGAGIQLSPNAVRVLEHLGVAQALSASVGVPDAIAIHEGTSGRVLTRLPLGARMRSRLGAPYWLAHRRDLQAALLDAVRAHGAIAVTTGFALETYAPEAAGVRATASDGREVTGAALIGADGVFSRVRGRLLAGAQPRFSGMKALRATLPVDRATALATDSVGVWLAPGAHVVHYPVRAGRELAVVVVAPSPTREEGWSIAADAGEVAASLHGFAQGLRDALTDVGEWRRWSLYELDPLAHWSHGAVTLLGDAAHPTLPFFAQGGAMALEDAAVLADALARSGNDLPAALAGYARARGSRTAAVVDIARRNGRIFHLSGPAAVARNLTLRALPATAFIDRLDWVYGWTP